MSEFWASELIFFFEKSKVSFFPDHMPKGCGIDSTPRALHILPKKKWKKKIQGKKKYFFEKKSVKNA